MIIKSSIKNYKVNFYNTFSFIDEIVKYKNIFCVIDKVVFMLYKDTLQKLIDTNNLFIIDAIEENKSIEIVLEIAERMVNLSSKRNTLLVSIGGGIVQDITGFIANILYRGIQWIWIPTTLLSQADSCIGSKTSLNFKRYKNLLGTFFPPDEIYINPEFVKTLDLKDYYSGLGEIFKFSIMQGKKSFYETKDKLNSILEYDFIVLCSEIEKALNYKKIFIETDEFDKGNRNLLNFGHTFGHALETVSVYKIPHGQAISIGMIIANQLSLDRGYISKEYHDDIREVINCICQKELINKEYFNMDILISSMKKDKKFIGDLHTCILLVGDEVKKFDNISDNEIEKSLVEVGKFFNEEIV